MYYHLLCISASCKNKIGGEAGQQILNVVKPSQYSM